MDPHVPVVVDGEVALAPAGDVVQFGGIGGRPASDLLIEHVNKPLGRQS